MTVIEADGENVEPVVVDKIDIFAGQRYSVVVQTHKNEKIGNYWIRANPSRGTQGFDGGINSAILRYKGFPKVEPQTNETEGGMALAEKDLHPLTLREDVSGIPDVSHTLNVSNNGVNFTVNGIYFFEPELPVLLQILSRARPPTDLLPQGSVFPLPGNSLVELIWPGGSVGSPHPIHLHGHTFSVVKSAGSTEVNLVNPVRRDVVAMGRTTNYNDTIIIRFRTDNPGPWIMHQLCIVWVLAEDGFLSSSHIDWHLAEGLAVVFAENVPAVEDLEPPVPWDVLCPRYNALPPDTK